jgi:hypothetical protein
MNRGGAEMSKPKPDRPRARAPARAGMIIRNAREGRGGRGGGGGEGGGPARDDRTMISERNGKGRMRRLKGKPTEPKVYAGVDC